MFYVVSVLRGINNAKIKENGHHNLPEFGKGMYLHTLLMRNFKAFGLTHILLFYQAVTYLTMKLESFCSIWCLTSICSTSDASISLTFFHCTKY